MVNLLHLSNLLRDSIRLMVNKEGIRDSSTVVVVVDTTNVVEYGCL